MDDILGNDYKRNHVRSSMLARQLYWQLDYRLDQQGSLPFIPYSRLPCVKGWPSTFLTPAFQLSARLYSSKQGQPLICGPFFTLHYTGDK